MSPPCKCSESSPRPLLQPYLSLRCPSVYSLGDPGIIQAFLPAGPGVQAPSTCLPPDSAVSSLGIQEPRPQHSPRVPLKKRVCRAGFWITTIDPSYWCRRQVISATPPSATVTFSVCTSCPEPGPREARDSLKAVQSFLSSSFLSHETPQSFSFPPPSVHSTNISCPLESGTGRKICSLEELSKI